MRGGFQENGCITTDIVDGQDGSTGGQVIGINLGWDHCAEHEWGIKDTKSAFGIPDKPERRCGVRGRVKGDLVGADTRTVTKVPSGLKFFEDLNGYAYLLFSSSFGWTDEDKFTAERFDRMLKAHGDEELTTVWSDSDFGIRMKNDALNLGTTVLGQIYEAFTKRDAMIFFGGQNNPFANRGLILAIRSRVPEEVLSQMKEADEDYLNLVEAVEKTGIEEKLKAAGLRYFALSPRWASSIKCIKDGETQTEHPVVFWLNPMEQDRHNYGWFTVEQLLDWIDGKGPIPKSQVV